MARNRTGCSQRVQMRATVQPPGAHYPASAQKAGMTWTLKHEDKIRQSEMPTLLPKQVELINQYPGCDCTAHGAGTLYSHGTASTGTRASHPRRRFGHSTRHHDSPDIEHSGTDHTQFNSCQRRHARDQSLCSARSRTKTRRARRRHRHSTCTVTLNHAQEEIPQRSTSFFQRAPTVIVRAAASTVMSRRTRLLWALVGLSTFIHRASAGMGAGAHNPTVAPTAQPFSVHIAPSSAPTAALAGAVAPDGDDRVLLGVIIGGALVLLAVLLAVAHRNRAVLKAVEQRRKITSHSTTDTPKATMI